MRARCQPVVVPLAAALVLAGRALGFVCPSVPCTAEDPNNLVDECVALGEPCPGGFPGEHCCLDGCPRRFCTAKEGAADPAPTRRPTPRPVANRPTRRPTPRPATNRPTQRPTPKPATPVSPRPGTAGGFCLTRRECEEASAGYDSFRSGAFATSTKGCFSKNGNAFFSPGSEEEMSDTNLPGKQERIRCGDAAEQPVEQPVGQGVFCQSEEECRAASSNMGFVSFASGRRYRTKGCFSKNGKAFFSPGSEEEMSDTNLPAAKERIRCARQNTNTCLTAEDCIAQSRKMGFARFQQGDFATKGCFYKKETVYFSPGTGEDMATTDLPGVLERISCGDAPTTGVALALNKASTTQVSSSLSEPGRGVSSGSTIKVALNCISTAAALIATAYLAI